MRDHKAITACVLLGLAGIVLGVLSPVLLLGGAIGGSDIGAGVAYGVFMELGLPWLFFLACAAASYALFRRRAGSLACVPAALPLLIEALVFLERL